MAIAGLTVLAGNAAAGTGGGVQAVPFEIQTLDGGGNNAANPTWGQSGRPYARVAAARYADGISQPVAGPNTRLVSNRLHNDVHQNIFSERGVTQWGFVWGQFIDHTFGLRDEAGTVANIPFNAADPIEEFTNTLGNIPFTRSAATPGTGTSTANPRQQTNTIGSYIDAFPVYGGTNARLDWLRNGSNDGNPANNQASLLLPNNYLPRRDARGNPATAPTMAIDGRLLANPNSASVAGDVRASENIGLNATHTLFAREHNRIVSQLPASLSEEDKFQIARRIVIAEQQFITYNEWLPAMGINLPTYAGYNSGVNATLTNEFATVGYRAHSMIHGEFEVEAEADRYTQAQLDAFEAGGIEIEDLGDGEIALVIPLNVAFFNPTLVPQIGLGPMLQAIGLEPQYKNDEQIDNQLRSVLFQVPVTGNPECLDGPGLPECFRGVADLGAIDIERDRDHGMPTYNQLRQAYGLPARTSFTQITGESTATFPAGSGVNNPNSLDFTQLIDDFGVSFPLDAERDPVRAVRLSTTAARLQAMYGNVNNVDAFAGMVAEPHITGSEFGELQRAIWTREFQRLRDGDRFFFGNQSTALNFIRNTYGIDFRRNLGDIIASNTDIPRAELNGNVFFDGGNVPPTSCRVQYVINSQWGTGSGGFNTTIRITNTGTTPIPAGWTVRFVFPNGQQIFDNWDSVIEQDEGRVPVQNVSYNASIAPGQTRDGIGFNASWTGTNGRPTAISLNTTACTVTS